MKCNIFELLAPLDFRSRLSKVDAIEAALRVITVPLYLYLPYNTGSPVFTVMGSSFLPGPAAITLPR